MGGVSSIQSLPLALGQAWLPHIMKLAVMARIYDNREPRDYEANPKLQEDPALLKRVRRLTFAHINGLEAFSMYAPAILACKVQGVSETTLAKAARVYLFLRTLYNVSWAIQGDSQARSYIRTVVWTASVAVVGSLYLAAARAK